MIIREALRDDTLRLEAFLKRHFETSMFLRSNLRDYGIGKSDHMHAMRYFLCERGGAIQGVGAISNSGTLMVQALEGLEQIAEFMRQTLDEETVYTAILGQTDQVGAFRKAFGLHAAKAYFDDVEPLFSLDLENLLMPDVSGVKLRRPTDADLPVLEQWSLAYMLETGLGKHTEEVLIKSKNDVTERIRSDNLRVLVKNGDLVAQTAFNAVLPDTVQIGGVYTPPEWRVRGYARKAVAMHLAEARATGVKNAVLFAADETASRAYRAIGFKQIGHYTITLFDPIKLKE